MNRKKLLSICGGAVVITVCIALILTSRSKSEAGNKGAQGVLPPVKAAADILADGRVVPYKSASLSLPSGGTVTQVAVTDGDTVKAGQLIVKLADGRQLAAVDEAKANLQKAEARLSQVEEGPSAEELSARYAALKAAQANLDKLNQGPEESLVTEAKANLEKAELVLREASSQPASNKTDEDVLAKAVDVYDKEVSIAPSLFSGPSQKAYQLGAAISSYKAAKKRLIEVQKGPTKAQIATAKAEIERVKAEIAALKDSQSLSAISLARADVAIARAALAQAQNALAETRLVAPFDGTVAAIYTKLGEMITPGTVVVKLGDTRQWLVETENLTEFAIAKISIGEAASVKFDALPHVKLAGKVTKIQGIGENRQGDITYAVTIKPLKSHPRLRWNMTAQVTFDEKGESKR